MPQHEPLDGDEIRLLTEVGMALAGTGQPAPACAIFDGLRTLRPQRAFAHVGRALALLNAGRAEEAARGLRDALPLVSDERPTVEAFLGLALQLAGRSAESQRMFATAAAADPALDGVVMARRMLGLPSAESASAPAAPHSLPRHPDKD